LQQIANGYQQHLSSSLDLGRKSPLLGDNVQDIVDKFYVQDIVDYPLMSVETSVTGKKPKDNLFLDKNQVGRYE